MLPGMVAKNKSDGCCPELELVCDIKTCPLAEECDLYEKLVESKRDGHCCPDYNCGECHRDCNCNCNLYIYRYFLDATNHSRRIRVGVRLTATSELGFEAISASLIPFQISYCSKLFRILTLKFGNFIERYYSSRAKFFSLACFLGLPKSESSFKKLFTRLPYARYTERN